MRTKSKGFTLIEMLVGIVIGMIVVAAASVMMVTVLKSQKDITASARLNQELGAAMAVMSNEIRRAGFSVCDIKKMHDATPPLACPDNDDEEEVPYIRYNTLATNKDLEIFDGIASSKNADCVLYRYNANLDNADGIEEHRGFRLNGNFIQMAGSAGDVKCDDPANSTKWKNLTNTDVINVTALSFSTTGSKCRNMTLPYPNPDPAVIAQYWVVKDKTATGMACESGTTPVDFHVAIDDPTNPLETFSDVTVPFTGTTTTVNSILVDLENGDQIFGTRQIRITLEATLTRDPAVTKRLESSVKVANPRVHCWPFSEHADCL